MASTAPFSSATRVRFKQSQATAALRTWMFHATKAADGTDATALTPVMTISKAGGAFAAPNAGTAITELTNGWYKVVHNAADLDTLGELGVRIAVATMDTLCVSHSVEAAAAGDAVTITDGSLTAAKFSTDALAALGSALISKTATVATLTSTKTSTLRSMATSFDTVVKLSGTFGGSTVQVQTTEDEGAAVVVWTDRSAGGLTAAGNVTLTGPHSAWRAIVTAGTATSVVVKATDRQYQGVR
jgi:hypothetical protein